jgi:hypothetical protein
MSQEDAKPVEYAMELKLSAVRRVLAGRFDFLNLPRMDRLSSRQAMGGSMCGKFPLSRRFSGYAGDTHLGAGHELE